MEKLTRNQEGDSSKSPLKVQIWEASAQTQMKHHDATRPGGIVVSVSFFWAARLSWTFAPAAPNSYASDLMIFCHRIESRSRLASGGASLYYQSCSYHAARARVSGEDQTYLAVPGKLPAKAALLENRSSPPKAS